ncbi:MAG TPA: tetratricopeptide repeat protein [Planctomycetaceae bacterium]|nr:tetratricopeptide repeat protein [Planctomycetaceae bacterium]
MSARAVTPFGLGPHQHQAAKRGWGMQAVENAVNLDTGGADALGRLCRSLLELLQSESIDQAIVAKTFSPLAHSIAHECSATAARLRGEIESWHDVSDELQRLSQSPFIHIEAETQPLLAKLTTAQAHAGQVIAALEGISTRHTTFAEHQLAETTRCSESPECGITQHDLSHTVAETRVTPAEPLRLERGVRDAYVERGRARVLQRQPAEAIDDFTRALQLREDDASTYTWRGNAYALCGRHAEAVSDYTRALELRPDLVLVRYNRAVSLRHAGCHDEALAELGRLIPLKPDHAPIYLNRGLIYLARNNPRLAVQEFKTALVHQPRSQEAAERLREAENLLAATRAPTVEPEPETKPEPEAAPVSVPEPHGACDPHEVLADAILASLPPLESTTATLPEIKPICVPQATVGPMASPLNLDFECPGCGCKSSVRWDKLQRGKILSCPNCKRNFTTRTTGELAEVVRDKSGRWSDLEEQLAERQGVRTHRLRLTAVAGIVALVVFTICWAPQIVRSSSISPEPALPAELQPRAELFARAWLEGDSRTLRRLADPVQDKLMFNWSRQAPAPAPPAGQTTDKYYESATIEIELLPSVAPVRWLRVHIRGLPDSSAQPELLLDLAWVERGGTWLFQPAPGT